MGMGQARKAAALAENFSPVDEAADERLKQEAKEEERNIKRTCEELGVRIHEVGITYRFALRIPIPVSLFRSTRTDIAYFPRLATNTPFSILYPPTKHAIRQSATQPPTIFIPTRTIFSLSCPLWMGKTVQEQLTRDL